MRRLHHLVDMPAGKTLAEVLPAWAGVTNEEVHVGQPVTACAACRKPFNAVRKRRKSFRLFPVSVCQRVPVAFAYSLCGQCFARYQRGGKDKEAIFAAIDAFSEGEWADQ